MSVIQISQNVIDAEFSYVIYMMVKIHITTVDARTLGKVLLQFVAVEPL